MHHAFLRGRRRDKLNEMDALVPTEHLQGQRLLYWQIGHDQSVRPGLLRLLDELLFAHAEDGVVVAHQNDRDIALLPHSGGELEHPLWGHTGTKCLVARPLDDRTVRHGVAERHADLDDVGTPLRTGHQVAERCLEGRISAGKIDDQRALVALLAIAERLFHPPCRPRPVVRSLATLRCHLINPMLNTVSRSLSPRPLTVMTTISSSFISFAR